ncbi:hypothetical protein AB0395_22085 [Streptosporangium sp. NPDC051023]|uniref:hypothetical protein n=1 Tax=Streptosporangium sp. NPDC051023 TaxID=3155410 RepID=UPI00344F51FC
MTFKRRCLRVLGWGIDFIDLAACFALLCVIIDKTLSPGHPASWVFWPSTTWLTIKFLMVPMVMVLATKVRCRRAHGRKALPAATAPTSSPRPGIRR